MVDNSGHIFRLLLIHVLKLGGRMKKCPSTYFIISLEINNHHFLFTREQYLLRKKILCMKASIRPAAERKRKHPRMGENPSQLLPTPLRFLILKQLQRGLLGKICILSLKDKEN